MPTTLPGPNMGPTLSLGATSCRPQPRHGQITAFSSTLEPVRILPPVPETCRLRVPSNCGRMKLALIIPTTRNLRTLRRLSGRRLPNLVVQSQPVPPGRSFRPAMERRFITYVTTVPREMLRGSTLRMFKHKYLGLYAKRTACSCVLCCFVVIRYIRMYHVLSS